MAIRDCFTLASAASSTIAAIDRTGLRSTQLVVAREGAQGDNDTSNGVVSRPVNAARLRARRADDAHERAVRAPPWLGVLASMLGSIVGCAARAAPPPRTIVAVRAAGSNTVATRVAPQPVAVSVAPGAPVDARGGEVFYRVCGPCHVAMWRVPSGGTLGSNGLSEAALRRQVREGSTGARGAMPAIDERALPEASMPVLLDYLRRLGVVSPRSP
jgi:hypothetical protein